MEKGNYDGRIDTEFNSFNRSIDKTGMCVQVIINLLILYSVDGLFLHFLFQSRR